jgi:predicted DNA-binding ribbon-helix-helix protein
MTDAKWQQKNKTAMPAPLYDRDFHQWTQQQIACLQQEQWAELDVDNLIEELADLGRSEQKELGSYLKVLLMHLLKWQYQPERRTQSWKVTIANCRDSIQDCLEDSPSLQRFLKETDWVAKYYRRACRDAAKETDLPADTFPAACPYTMAQILDTQFWPQA